MSEKNSRRSNRWWPLRTTHKRIRNGLATDRDRWIYVRKSYTKEANPSFYGGEYDKLCADHRVAKLVVSEDDGIRLTTVPVIKVLHHERQRYAVYLGTYEVHVILQPYSLYLGTFTSHSVTNFKVLCVHSGRYDGVLSATYPIASSHQFCFGVRTEFLEELANTGEFYTFYTVMLDSLWHINQLSKPSIIRDFRKVDDNRNIEPYRKPHAALPNPFND